MVVGEGGEGKDGSGSGMDRREKRARRKALSFIQCILFPTDDDGLNEGRRRYNNNNAESASSFNINRKNAKGHCNELRARAKLTF